MTPLALRAIAWGGGIKYGCAKVGGSGGIGAAGGAAGAGGPMPVAGRNNPGGGSTAECGAGLDVFERITWAISAAELPEGGC
eukprot:CAMPEP_0202878992 /NCGR_PEP_ID=MMETSP1391-20130828/33013_1 /ASSEMBLY_ACC=CAM_ASM_000867 /TAXON_ID=1034604 /ORGANISM="Chlamydomonas leiostraca, Strain SAG 11-49" /LENGTH=81 /DNA_ID=CAMNT_0049561289 /DNA_START=118 /DNA_END=363 /DNA_ORIENTATION=+